MAQITIQIDQSTLEDANSIAVAMTKAGYSEHALDATLVLHNAIAVGIAKMLRVWCRRADVNDEYEKPAK